MFVLLLEQDCDKKLSCSYHVLKLIQTLTSLNNSLNLKEAQYILERNLLYILTRVSCIDLRVSNLWKLNPHEQKYFYTLRFKKILKCIAQIQETKMDSMTIYSPIFNETVTGGVYQTPEGRCIFSFEGHRGYFSPVDESENWAFIPLIFTINHWGITFMLQNRCGRL